jgi:hypothetical protein
MVAMTATAAPHNKSIGSNDKTRSPPDDSLFANFAARLKVSVMPSELIATMLSMSHCADQMLPMPPDRTKYQTDWLLQIISPAPVTV